MAVKQITAQRIISEADAEKLAGKFLTEKHVKILVNEDADVYDTYGNLLVRFRKGAVDRAILQAGWDNFKGSITTTDGRGVAAGEMFFRKHKDGTDSKIKISNKVESGNVGYMDAGSMIHYCRMTAFGAENEELFKLGTPFVEHIDELYKHYCPDHYKKQRAIADATNRNYIIGDSCFTTVTVNRNFQTAVHKDSGDLPGGFGNMAIIDDGNYEGSYTCLPEFGIGVDARAGDMMFADVHRWHGNTPFIPKAPQYLRGTFVLYYREYMLKCKQPKEELFQLKMDKSGFMKL